MDNWLALFDGQPRYLLEINDSAVKPDVLNFTGREALSEADTPEARAALIIRENLMTRF